MDSSNLTKLVIGLAVAMGALAMFASSSADAPAEVAEASVAQLQAEPVAVELIGTQNVIHSTRREKAPTLSTSAKEARARQEDEMERIPPNWGDRGMPPTDSVTKRVVNQQPVRP